MGPGGFTRGGTGQPGVGQGAQPGSGQGGQPGVAQGGQPGVNGRGGFGDGGRAGGGGGMGGLLQATTPSAELTTLLSANASAYTWIAAAVGSNAAAGYQLATGRPVMAVGGFNGTDPAPTLAQFKQYVAEGKIHYFIGGGMSGGMGMRGGAGTAANGTGGSQDASEIAAWVQDTFTATTVGNETVYDLTAK
jgi:hypothetical protein